ncbi:MAG: hypothetical protein KGO49_02265 [Gammaproteobacteria bacterium]|nr:hypothetical protein [Gammaproteobacteria bacterium]
MLKLNMKHSLLTASILTALTLSACQETKVAPPPAPAPVVLPALIVPPVPEDPLAIEIKAIDRSNIDARILLMGKYARHYPPHFTNPRARHAAEAEVKDLLKTLNPIASNPRATHAELLQGFKANGLARNLDIGSNTTSTADGYIRRALKMDPKDPETNFWFGVLLSEGGGMTEGIPYLNKAAKGGYNEAHLSLANAYLQLDKKQKALAELKEYQRLMPDDTRVPDMIDAVKADKASIW